MDLRQMEYIVKLSDTGSFSKAAQELFISKQGLNRNIQNLEEELNASLYTSTVSGTVLTEAGSAVCNFAKKMLLEYNMMLKEVQAAADNHKRSLRICFANGFFYCISMDLILSFLNKYPDIKYDYQCFIDFELERQFLNGNFDMAFSTNRVHQEGLEYTWLFRNRRCLAVHKDHPLARLESVRIEDLRGVNIAVSAPGYYDYPFIVEQCRNCGFEPLLYPLPEWQMLIQVAESGQSVALIVESLRGEKNVSENLLLIPFADEEMSSYNVNIVTVASRKKQPHIEGFIKHAVSYCDKR